MSKEKTFQVKEEILVDMMNLLSYLKDYDLGVNARNLCTKIEIQLNAKLAAIERREAFSAYKNAPQGSQEREDNRVIYLDISGIHPDWRTKNETHV